MDLPRPPSLSGGAGEIDDQTSRFSISSADIERSPSFSGSRPPRSPSLSITKGLSGRLGVVGVAVRSRQPTKNEDQGEGSGSFHVFVGIPPAPPGEHEPLSDSPKSTGEKGGPQRKSLADMAYRQPQPRFQQTTPTKKREMLRSAEPDPSLDRLSRQDSSDSLQNSVDSIRQCSQDSLDSLRQSPISQLKILEEVEDIDATLPTNAPSAVIGVETEDWKISHQRRGFASTVKMISDSDRAEFTPERVSQQPPEDQRLSSTSRTDKRQLSQSQSGSDVGYDFESDNGFIIYEHLRIPRHVSEPIMSQAYAEPTLSQPYAEDQRKRHSLPGREGFRSTLRIFELLGSEDGDENEGESPLSKPLLQRCPSDTSWISRQRSAANLVEFNQSFFETPVPARKTLEKDMPEQKAEALEIPSQCDESSRLRKTASESSWISRQRSAENIFEPAEEKPEQEHTEDTLSPLPVLRKGMNSTILRSGRTDSPTASVSLSNNDSLSCERAHPDTNELEAGDGEPMKEPKASSDVSVSPLPSQMRKGFGSAVRLSGLAVSFSDSVEDASLPRSSSVSRNAETEAQEEVQALTPEKSPLPSVKQLRKGFNSTLRLSGMNDSPSTAPLQSPKTPTGVLKRSPSEGSWIERGRSSANLVGDFEGEQSCEEHQVYEDSPLSPVNKELRKGFKSTLRLAGMTDGPVGASPQSSQKSSPDGILKRTSSDQLWLTRGRSAANVFNCDEGEERWAEQETYPEPVLSPVPKKQLRKGFNSTLRLSGMNDSPAPLQSPKTPTGVLKRSPSEGSWIERGRSSANLIGDFEGEQSYEEHQVYEDSPLSPVNKELRKGFKSTLRLAGMTDGPVGSSPQSSQKSSPDSILKQTSSDQIWLTRGRSAANVFNCAEGEQRWTEQETYPEPVLSPVSKAQLRKGFNSTLRLSGMNEDVSSPAPPRSPKTPTGVLKRSSSEGSWISRGRSSANLVEDCEGAHSDEEQQVYPESPLSPVNKALRKGFNSTIRLSGMNESSTPAPLCSPETPTGILKRSPSEGSWVSRGRSSANLVEDYEDRQSCDEQQLYPESPLSPVNKEMRKGFSSTVRLSGMEETAVPPTSLCSPKSASSTLPRHPSEQSWVSRGRSSANLAEDFQATPKQLESPGSSDSLASTPLSKEKRKGFSSTLRLAGMDDQCELARHPSEQSWVSRGRSSANLIDDGKVLEKDSSVDSIQDYSVSPPAKKSIRKGFSSTVRLSGMDNAPADTAPSRGSLYTSDTYGSSEWTPRDRSAANLMELGDPQEFGRPSQERMLSSTSFVSSIGATKFTPSELMEYEANEYAGPSAMMDAQYYDPDPFWDPSLEIQPTITISLNRGSETDLESAGYGPYPFPAVQDDYSFEFPRESTVSNKSWISRQRSEEHLDPESSEDYPHKVPTSDNVSINIIENSRMHCESLVRSPSSDGDTHELHGERLVAKETEEPENSFSRKDSFDSLNAEDQWKELEGSMGIPRVASDWGLYVDSRENSKSKRSEDNERPAERRKHVQRDIEDSLDSSRGKDSSADKRKERRHGFNSTANMIREADLDNKKVSQPEKKQQGKRHGFHSTMDLMAAQSNTARQVAYSEDLSDLEGTDYTQEIVIPLGRSLNQSFHELQSGWSFRNRSNAALTSLGGGPSSSYSEENAASNEVHRLGSFHSDTGWYARNRSNAALDALGVADREVEDLSTGQYQATGHFQVSFEDPGSPEPSGILLGGFDAKRRLSVMSTGSDGTPFLVFSTVDSPTAELNMDFPEQTSFDQDIAEPKDSDEMRGNSNEMRGWQASSQNETRSTPQSQKNSTETIRQPSVSFSTNPQDATGLRSPSGTVTEAAPQRSPSASTRRNPRDVSYSADDRQDSPDQDSDWRGARGRSDADYRVNSLSTTDNELWDGDKELSYAGASNESRNPSASLQRPEQEEKESFRQPDHRQTGL